MKILVTGGAGFIGSAFVRMVAAGEPSTQILNLDKLTYAGNLENCESVARLPNYEFHKADICDEPAVEEAFAQSRPDAVVHFAAESHVDRSILSPAPVIDTNVRGTLVLLEAARRHGVRRFVHVSTDEVYGSIEEPEEADEKFPLNASSPYSAAKASSDLLALSYFRTYRLPVIVTRASNNYGPFQFPEKLIPLMIANALEDKPLPVYGDGRQIRDWLHVEDHCRAIRAILDRGAEGEIYNIGGNCSLTNLEVVRRILEAAGRSDDLIRYVTDRPGHDRRYALRSDKIQEQTDWSPAMPFEKGLRETVDWYRQNPGWIDRVKTGAYRDYYERNYGAREAAASFQELS